MMSRSITKVVQSQEVEVQAGLKTRRIIENISILNLDPFVMLDEFKVMKPAEFSDHPHRGFESVTYMLSGSIRHEDSLGYNSVVTAGDLQCITAGRGIIHHERPIGSRLGHGLDIWLSLPKKNKMMAPAFQILLDIDIPRTTEDGVTIKVIAGESSGMKTPLLTKSSYMFLELQLDKGARLVHAVPEKWSGFLYVLSGSALFGPEDKATVGQAHQLLQMGPGKSIEVTNNGDDVCHFVLLAGKPLHEPIVHNGLFVMNERHEIHEAVDDCHFSRNGFERIGEWKSSVTKKKYLNSRLPFL